VGRSRQLWEAAVPEHSSASSRLSRTDALTVGPTSPGRSAGLLGGDLEQGPYDLRVYAVTSTWSIGAGGSAKKCFTLAASSASKAALLRAARPRDACSSRAGSRPVRTTSAAGKSQNPGSASVTPRVEGRAGADARGDGAVEGAQAPDSASSPRRRPAR